MLFRFFLFFRCLRRLFDGGLYILPYNYMNTYTLALILMAFSIYKCLWNTYCKLFEGNDHGHWWHILNVHRVNVWVSSGLPSVLPSFTQFSSSFPSPNLSHFSTLPFASLFLLSLSHCMCHSSSSSSSSPSDFIIMANQNLFQDCLYLPFLFIAIHKLLENILAWLPYFLAYPCTSWSL